MPKATPPRPVAPETWRALLAAAADFAAIKPWEFAYDTDAIGLIDPVTGETRIGTVLVYCNSYLFTISLATMKLRACGNLPIPLR